MMTDQDHEEQEPEAHDHDLDYPWTLYFNGEPMPRWSNCWSLCHLLQHANGSIMDETYYGLRCLQDLQDLQDRMDLAHIVDSEDGNMFRICCLTLLALLLEHKSAVLEALAPWNADDSKTAEDIYTGVRGGLVAMHALTLRDGFAFWSVGYDTDFVILSEAMKRAQLPSSHPDHLEPPHVRKRRADVSARLRALRCSLLGSIETQKLSKDIRRFIHDLPTKA
ncbi:MAG: hypothetical protein JWL81_2874 [Verrucomicrobiales bacterium]|nr:hypothetical protein [Verrucomicrobiales bacterium]